MKKLLFLGGSDIQIPGIKYAKSLGYYVITCDYLPNNPGHKVSDKYYDISKYSIQNDTNFKVHSGNKVRTVELHDIYFKNG